MLVVFEIEDTVLLPAVAQLLAERETLWVFCKTYRVLESWKIEGDTPITTVITAPSPEPPVKLVPPPSKRTTAKKKYDGSVPKG